MMVRSFDRRIEALFLITNAELKREAINILYYNLQDNHNSYIMREDGTYIKRRPGANEEVVDIHKLFFNKAYATEDVELFEQLKVNS